MSEIDPLARAEEKKVAHVRVGIDLSPVQSEFLARFGAYRNALNKLEERDVPTWTRKSTAEAFVDAQIERVATNMKDVFDRLGEMPPADDEKAMMAYAKAAIELTDKLNKKR